MLYHSTYVAGRKLSQQERINPAVAQTVLSVTADGHRLQALKPEDLSLLCIMTWELYMKAEWCNGTKMKYIANMLMN
jgi:hypothetical protein